MLFLIFKLACFVIVFGVVGYIGYIMVTDWRATPAEERDEVGEIIALGAGSLTKAWLRIVALVSGAISAIGFAVPALQLPEAQNAINKYFPSEWVTAVILGIAVIGLLSRSRTSEDGRWL